MQTQTEKKPKLTPEALADAVPKVGSITLRQLAIKVGCSVPYTSKIAKVAVQEFGIKMFLVSGSEQNFRRVKGE